MLSLVVEIFVVVSVDVECYFVVWFIFEIDCWDVYVLL